MGQVMVYAYIYGIVAYVLDCNIVVSKFELQLCYDIHFWTNTLGKGMNLLIPPVVSITTVLQGWLWHEGWYAIKQRNQIHDFL